MTQKSIKDEAGPEKKGWRRRARRAWRRPRRSWKDVRAAVDAVTERYDELNTDASVRKALLKLEKDKVGTFKLGPFSTTFKTAVKAPENAELDDPGEADDRGVPEEGETEAVIVRGARIRKAERADRSGIRRRVRPSPDAAEARPAYPGRTRPDRARRWHRRQGDRGRRTGVGPGRRFGTRERVAADVNRRCAIRADGNRRRSNPQYGRAPGRSGCAASRHLRMTLVRVGGRDAGPDESSRRARRGWCRGARRAPARQPGGDVVGPAERSGFGPLAAWEWGGRNRRVGLMTRVGHTVSTAGEIPSPRGPRVPSRLPPVAADSTPTEVGRRPGGAAPSAPRFPRACLRKWTSVDRVRSSRSRHSCGNSSKRGSRVQWRVRDERACRASGSG